MEEVNKQIVYSSIEKEDVKELIFKYRNVIENKRTEVLH